MHEFIRTYLRSAALLLERVEVETVSDIVEVLFAAYRAEGEIFVIGNGGSAASASHFVCDLSKSTITDKRPRVRATCLTDNVPLLTAWANDTDYRDIFGQALRSHARPGDVLVACTASGVSPNIVAAIRTARKLGVTSVALVGAPGGRMPDECDIALVIDSTNIPQIEDVQMLLFHAIATAMKEKMR